MSDKCQKCGAEFDNNVGNYCPRCFTEIAPMSDQVNELAREAEIEKGGPEFRAWFSEGGRDKLSWTEKEVRYMRKAWNASRNHFSPTTLTPPAAPATGEKHHREECECDQCVPPITEGKRMPLADKVFALLLDGHSFRMGSYAGQHQVTFAQPDNGQVAFSGVTRLAALEALLKYLDRPQRKEK